MLHVNSFNTLPIFLTVSMVVGEPAKIGMSLAAAAPGFTPVFALLIFSGCVLTWSQFMCAAVCSALTTSMISVAKSVIQKEKGRVRRLGSLGEVEAGRVRRLGSLGEVE